MGIVDKISEAVGLTSSEIYTYRCEGCGETFDSSIPRSSLVTCLECGGQAVERLDTDNRS